MKMSFNLVYEFIRKFYWLYEHSHIYWKISNYPINAYVVIAKYKRLFYGVVSVRNDIAQGTMPFVVFSAFDFYRNSMTIMFDYKI